MSILGNILWVILGGLVLSLGYFLSGLIMCLTIVGIPFGLQIFKLAGFALLPFGKSVYLKPASEGKSVLMTILNVIWIIFFGLELALVHLVTGAVFCVTIIGIPFGLQHFKLMRMALVPFGYGYN